MHNNYYKIVVAIVFCLFSTTVLAADINAGKTRAAGCLGCHGAEGHSNSPLFPNLAGQMPQYLETQLKNFKTGTRINQIMQGLAVDLSDQEIANLAAFFASLPVKASKADAELAKTGKDKAAICAGCHNTNFEGRVQVPGLAGQQPGYLAKQLRDFKTNQRKFGPMNAVAATLTEEDIKAISAYLATLSH